MNRISFISIAVLVGLISACGFQLRGVTELPDELKQMRLIDDNLTIDQISVLSEILVKAGARLSDSLDNTVQLNVTVVVLPERNLADAGGSGQTIVRISRQLSYSVKKPEDTLPMQTKTIERQVDIAQDSNNLLGTGSEKKSAEEALDRTLFNQLINQLKRL